MFWCHRLGAAESGGRVSPGQGIGNFVSLDHGRVPGQTKMQVELKHRCRGNQVLSYGASARDLRIERLIDRLPRCFRPIIHWLRQPSSLWIRIPAGVLLTCGGLFGFLPVLGFWMFPLGLILLAEDAPWLRSMRSRILDWIERRHPHWLNASVRN